MSMTQLLQLYFLIGLCCAAVIVWRAPESRAKALPSAAAAVVVWPLWVPFALSTPPPPGAPGTAPAAPAHPTAQRINASLQSLQDNDPGGLVGHDDIATINGAVARATQRLFEMGQHLQKQHAETDRRSRRIAAQHDGAATSAAERHAATVTRLEHMKQREERTLEELADVIDLMNVQLTLARFGDGSSLDELKAELWLRIEAVDETRELA